MERMAGVRSVAVAVLMISVMATTGVGTIAAQSAGNQQTGTQTGGTLVVNAEGGSQHANLTQNATDVVYSSDFNYDGDPAERGWVQIGDRDDKLFVEGSELRGTGAREGRNRAVRARFTRRIDLNTTDPFRIEFTGVRNDEPFFGLNVVLSTAETAEKAWTSTSTGYNLNLDQGRFGDVNLRRFNATHSVTPLKLDRDRNGAAVDVVFEREAGDQNITILYNDEQVGTLDADRFDRFNYLTVQFGGENAGLDKVRILSNSSKSTEIADWNDLEAVREDPAGEYALVTDLNASTEGYETVAGPNANDGAGFEPIGSASQDEGLFTGTFVGNGHTISNLTINRPSENYVGLFGSLGDGTIRNVTLSDVNVTGRARVGGLVGYAEGNIADSAVAGNVTATSAFVGGGVGYTRGATLRNVTACGTVQNLGNTDAGGLIGFHQGTVRNSAADSTVSAPSVGNVGGLIGSTGRLQNGGASIVRNSKATGNVTGNDRVGGLIGKNAYGSISRSVSTGHVEGSELVGGLVGSNPIDRVGAISQSYSRGAVSGEEIVGGLVGKNIAPIRRSFSTGTVAGENTVGGLVANNLDQFGGSVTGSYWDIESATQSTSDGGTGLNTNEMTGGAAVSNMTRLDFENTWNTTDSYPILLWQDVQQGVLEETLIVDKAGTDGNYTEIQPAIDNASDGDRIEVRPGTYREEVTLNKNVTLVAPDGATLNGSSSFSPSPTGITIPSMTHVSPTIEGITITGFAYGVNASATNGDVIIENATITQNEFEGVRARNSQGDWTLTDVTVTQNEAYGIDADESRGDWSLTNVTLTQNGDAGIRIGGFHGNLSITNSNISRNAGDIEGINARSATGTVQVHDSTIIQNGNPVIDATGANPQVNATQNWWGDPSGPEPGDCVGNVTCANPLSSPPGEFAGRTCTDVNSVPAEIDQSGCYTLNTTNTNITAFAAVEIRADDVILRGDGNTLAAGTDSAKEGVVVRNETPIENVTVRNLTVRGFNRSGLSVSDGNDVTVENVTANGQVGSGSYGVELVDTSTASLDRVTANRNGGDGIRILRGSDITVTNTTLLNNNQSGFTAEVGAENITVRDTNASLNTGEDFGHGIFFDGVTNGSMRNITAIGNNGEGVDVFNSRGIELAGSELIDNNGGGVSVFDSRGIELARSELIDNTVSGLAVVDSRGISVRDTNASLNTGEATHGISFFGVSNGSIRNLTAIGNSVTGVSLAGLDVEGLTTPTTNITIEHSTLRANRESGLRVQSSTLRALTNDIVVRNVTASSQGSDGFQIFKSSNVTITNATARNNSESAITLANARRVTVENSVARANDKGIHLTDSVSGLSAGAAENNTITNVTAIDNEISLAIRGDTAPAQNNTFGDLDIGTAVLSTVDARLFDISEQAELPADTPANWNRTGVALDVSARPTAADNSGFVDVTLDISGELEGTDPSALDLWRYDQAQEEWIQTDATVNADAATISNRFNASCCSPVALLRNEGGSTSQSSGSSSSGGSEPDDDEPPLALSASSIEFDDSRLSGSNDRSFTLTNDGVQTVTVDRIEATDSAFVPDTSSFSLDPGESTTIQVRFEPDGPGTYTGNLSFQTDDEGIFSLPLRGTLAETDTNVSTTQEPDRRVVEVLVTDPVPGEPVQIPLPGDRLDRPDIDAAFENLTLTPDVSEDFNVQIITSPEPLSTTPPFGPRETNGTVPLTFANITKTIANEGLQTVTVRARISKARLAGVGARPETVVLFRYEGDRWVPKPTRVVAETNRTVVVAATAAGLSEWTAGARRPRFNITDAIIDLQTATIGETVTIQAFIENTGGADGLYEAELLVNETVVDQRRTSIPPGGTAQLNFPRSFEAPQTYEVRVNNFTVGSVTVNPSSQGDGGTEPATADSTDSQPQGGELGGFTPIAVGVLIALSVAAVLLARTVRGRE